MRRIAITLTIVLFAAACGGSSGPWRDNIVTASTEIGSIDQTVPLSGLTDDAAAEEGVQSYCESPTQPESEEDLAYVYAALTPLDARAKLTTAGVSEDTIKQLYEGIDGGMDDKCPDQKEAIFSVVPYSGWADSLKCNIPEDFEFLKTTSTIVDEACAG